MSEPNFASLGPTLLARKGGAKPAMRPQLAPLPENFGEVADEANLEDLGWNDMGAEVGGERSDQLPASDFESYGDELIIDPLKGADVVSIKTRQALEGSDRRFAANEDTPGPAGPLLRQHDKSPARAYLTDAVMESCEAAPGDDLEHADEGADSDQAEATSTGPLLRTKEPAGKRASGKRSISSRSDQPRPAARSQKGARRAAFTLRLDPDRHLKLRLASTIQGISAQALLTEALDAMLAEFEELDALTAHIERR